MHSPRRIGRWQHRIRYIVNDLLCIYLCLLLKFINNFGVCTKKYYRKISNIYKKYNMSPHVTPGEGEAIGVYERLRRRK